MPQHRNTLPCEVISLVLGYVETRQDLYQCALVNTRFHTLSNPKLWHSPTNWDEHLKKDRIDRLSRGLQWSIMSGTSSPGKHIRKLYFDSKVPATLISWVATFTPLLEALNITETRTTGEHLKLITRACPRLKTLLVNGRAISAGSMASLGEHCRQLRELELHSPAKVPPNFLKCLKHCQLEELSLMYCRGLKKKRLGSGILQLSGLTTLRLIYCDIDDPLAAIQQLLPKNGILPLPHLKEFEVAALPEAIEYWTQFIQTRPLLESFHVKSCAMTDDLLAIIPTYMPKLTRLILDSNRAISSRAVRQFIKGLPLLSYIRFEYCTILSRFFPEIMHKGLLLYDMKLNNIKRVQHNTQFDAINLDEDLTPKELDHVRDLSRCII